MSHGQWNPLYKGTLHQLGFISQQGGASGDPETTVTCGDSGDHKEAGKVCTKHYY